MQYIKGSVDVQPALSKCLSRSKTLLTVVGSIAAIIGDEFSQVVWVYLKVW